MHPHAISVMLWPQFFSDLTEFVTSAADVDGKHVIVAGLDGDFQRRKFGQLLDLVPMAESVTKLQGTCTCGRPSAFSLRKAANHDQELVGGANLYSPVCRLCYNNYTKAHVANGLP
ncbi:thymidine kinase [Dunaliella salina]|uniref:Thymidine kinase n=1 Tax=Dunaliella salina TaxID=3046 RepID=A0ABQ7GJN1_DUNSA|nr:thymidine kinase [Dunaliella salina]|eukprot:KAF5834816.1 thymidine kinase [Dunaliella salina]